MTAKAWDNGTRYGKKLAAYFTKLDTLIQRQFKQAAAEGLTIEEHDKLLRTLHRQTTIVYSIQKLREGIDTNKRIEDLEQLIKAATPEAIAAAQQRARMPPAQ